MSKNEKMGGIAMGSIFVLVIIGVGLAAAAGVKFENWWLSVAIATPVILWGCWFYVRYANTRDTEKTQKKSNDKTFNSKKYGRLVNGVIESDTDHHA